MAAEELILATNPGLTQESVRIERENYEIVREAILNNLRTYGPMTFTQLGDLLEDQLQKDFGGSVMWNYATVKLDLEARGEIHRVPKSKPQLIGLNDESRDF